MPARSPHSHSRREQIITVTLEIISDEGIKNLTVKKIADKIGISDAALYRHFKNKQEITLATIETVGQHLSTHIGEAVANVESSPEKLKEILRVHLNYLEQNKGIPRLVFSEEVHQNDPRLRKALLSVVSRYLDMVSSILNRAKESGQVKSDIDVEATAVAFLGLVQATAFIWSLSGFNFSLNDRTPALWQAFSESLN